MANEAAAAPIEIYAMIVVLFIVLGLVAYNIVTYAPGQKQAIKIERRNTRHTRSHHSKLSGR
jgi:hypothetical protein